MSGTAMSSDARLTIIEHLEELRDRLIVIAVALVVSTGFSFVFRTDTLRLLLRLAGPDYRPQSLSPTETFFVDMKVALVAGVALAMPVILYEIVRFLLPALTPQEKGYLALILPTGTLSFVAGLAFGYIVTVPAMLNFFLNYQSQLVNPQWRIDEYISLVTTVLFWMGVVFELPLVMFFLAKIGIVNTKKLTSFRRYWIVAASIIAAVVTPTPDPINMMAVMIPLVILYEIGVLFTRLAGR